MTTIQLDGVVAIKPRHASRLWSGSKRAEFRRVPVRLTTPAWLAVYETRPIGMVTGLIEVLAITYANAADFAALLDWENDPNERAIVADYLTGSRLSSALHVGRVHVLPRQTPLSELGVFSAPQSYSFFRSPVMVDADVATPKQPDVPPALQGR